MSKPSNVCCSQNSQIHVKYLALFPARCLTYVWPFYGYQPLKRLTALVFNIIATAWNKIVIIVLVVKVVLGMAKKHTSKQMGQSIQEWTK